MPDLPEMPGTEGSPAPEFNASTPPPFQPIAPPFQQVANSYQPVAGSMPQPVASPAPSGGMSTVKIVLIIVAVFVCLGLMALGVIGYGVWRVAHAVHKNLTDNGMTIDTPGGSISTTTGKNYSAEELGVDLYPGAQPGRGGMHMALPTGSITAANYVTSDSKQQVVDFYKSKLGSKALPTEIGEKTRFSLNKGNRDSVILSIEQESSQADGKTQIHIVHTVNKGS